MKQQIICTLGPSSLRPEIIHRLEKSGVSLFRINLSHTPLEKVAPSIEIIRSATEVPICLDCEGAQIRNRYMQGGKVAFSEGQMVTLTSEAIEGDGTRMSLTPECVVSQLLPGDILTVDFNSLIFKIVESDGVTAQAMVLAEGEAGNNKAITLVNRDISLPPLTEKDRGAIEVGLKYNVEWYALSFAGSADDVRLVRELSQGKMKVISKIESRRGLANLQAIINETDSILIDRGDLSREISIEKVPFWQKEIIRSANASRKKVYVATNLLESMVSQMKPTRAEVNDIVNTLLDGADGLVLAAETAIGQFPVACAKMVAKIIKSYGAIGSTFTPYSLMNSPDLDLGLNEPLGGPLVDRLSHLGRPKSNLEALRVLKVPQEVLIDAEQIAVGAYSPLQGFMNQAELDSVLKGYRLPSGVVWTLPVLLSVPEAEWKSIQLGEEVALQSETDGKNYAVIRITDKFTKELSPLAKDWFGTDSDEHPGVRRLKRGGNHFIAGTVDLLEFPPNALRPYIFTPAETRRVFESKGWSTVVGFHSRNVAHRGHEYLLRSTLDRMEIDGLLIHPVIGPKKAGDYEAPVLLKSYMKLVDTYPKQKVLLGAFHTYSRYAGPREAVFTALCRRNFGCTHFIVGRDHTGVGNFYDDESSRRLFQKLGDIGITPLFFDKVFFCTACEKMVESCAHGMEHAVFVSGTTARDFFKKGEFPPDFIMHPAVAEVVAQSLRDGAPTFVE